MQKIYIFTGLLVLIVLIAGCSKNLLVSDANPVNTLPGEGQAATGYSFGAVIATNPSNVDSLLATTYSNWKARYVTSSGAGVNLRVQRPENGNDTVSEGMAYGMLIAAYQKDKTTFDKLWAFTKSVLNSKGLMAWHISATGVILDTGSASDADEDFALALVVADAQWGGYKTEATSMISKVLANDVDGSGVFKPGDSWGSTTVVNPSYLAPAWYHVFRDYTGTSTWGTVATKSYTILNLVKNNTTGLVPDWTTSAGGSAAAVTWDTHKDDYYYDATRAPLRIAIDYLWYGNSDALNISTLIGTFFQSKGITSIKDGYLLSGTAFGTTHNATFIGPIAAAASAGNTTLQFKNDIYNELVNVGTNGNYYNDTLRLVSLLVVTGKFFNPVKAMTPLADLIIDNFEGAFSWSTFAGSASYLTINQNGALSKEGSKSLFASLVNNDYCGFYKNFTPTVSWIGYSYLKYWIFGDNSNKEIRLEINDNGSERFEYKFSLNFSGWKQMIIPLSGFSRRADWQPSGVPNDGFTLTAVEGLSFAPTLMGSCSFYLDAIKLSTNNAADVPLNNTPIANAGSNQSVYTGSVVSLSGAGSSDPDGDLLTYSWTKISGPAVTLSNATSVSPQFTPTLAGVYVYSLVVNDGKVNSVASRVTINVATAPPPSSNDVTVEAFDSITGLSTFKGSSSLTIVKDTARKTEGIASVKMTYNLTDYCGFGKDFSTPQNWTAYNTIGLNVYGNNNGKRYRLELTDNGGERFEYIIIDNFSGWKLLNIPYAVLVRRSDWQPAGAPNDGLTLTGVMGYSFSPLSAGSGSLNVDRMSLKTSATPPTVTVDSLDAIGQWVAFYGPSSVVNLSLNTATKVSGTGALQMTLTNNDYAGVGKAYSTPLNWVAYSLVKVWLKGSNSGKKIRFEIADANDESFEYQITDNSTSWQQVIIPFGSFVRRTDWQPAGVPNNGFTLSGIRGLSFAPTTTGSGTWYFDQIEVQ